MAGSATTTTAWARPAAQDRHPASTVHVHASAPAADPTI
jgi:hypothetical protein